MDIQEIVEEHLEEIEADDLVVIEGGGNGLVEIGTKHSLEKLKKVVGMVKRKTKQNPIVVCIPMRRGEEASSFGRTRCSVNLVCIKSLEDWRCDGLQLWEKCSWGEVWARDGVHLTILGKRWMARCLVEWAQHREGDQQA